MAAVSQHRLITQLVSWDRRLWVAALAFFGVGDAATTYFGLHATNVKEVGPFVTPVVEAYGIGAVIGVKALTLLLAYAGYRIAPSPINIGIPLGLAVLGAVVTTWNVFILIMYWAIWL